MQKSGVLWIIPTPLGNLSDFSTRIVDTLRVLPILAAEDTRQCRKICSHFNIPSPKLIRCDESTERKAAEEIIRHLGQGEDVGFLTDAGTPSISDPGWRLIDSVTRSGHSIMPLPGPSAVTMALSACHFPTTPFTFVGFLDRKEGKRKKQMTSMLENGGASVFFESPHRIQRTILELAEFDPDREILIGREMTKKFEEYVRGPLKNAAQHVAGKKPLGEYTIVVSPSTMKSR